MTQPTSSQTNQVSPDGNLLLPDDVLDRVLVSYQQAIHLLRRRLPDLAPEDLELFVNQVFEKRLVLSIAEVLEFVITSMPLPYVLSV